MNKSTELSHETQKSLNFQERFESITDRELNPEVFDTFADDALEDLVELVQEVITKHNVAPNSQGLKGEHEALIRSGLDPEIIESTLDRIDQVASLVNKAIGVASRAPIEDSVYIPPDTAPFIGGDGEFEQKRNIPRLETVLFIIENSFNIDISEAAELVSIRQGIVAKNMVRRMPYSIISVPELKRHIAVCNEAENATYVFNDLWLSDEQRENLPYLTKLEYKKIIKENPEYGRVVRYTSKFTESITHAITPAAEQNLEIGSTAVLKVERSVKTDRVTIPDIKEALGGGIDGSHIKKWLELNEYTSIMEKPYRGARQSVPTYSRDAVDEIMSDEKIAYLLAVPNAPDNSLSLAEYAKDKNISGNSLRKVMSEYHMPVGDYRVGVRRKIGARLLEADQRYLDSILEKKGLTAEASRSDEYSLLRAADVLGVSHPTVSKYVKQETERNPEFGELRQRKPKGPGRVYIVLSEAQLAMVKDAIVRGRR